VATTKTTAHPRHVSAPPATHGCAPSRTEAGGARLRCCVAQEELEWLGPLLARVNRSPEVRKWVLGFLVMAFGLSYAVVFIAFFQVGARASEGGVQLLSPVCARLTFRQGVAPPPLATRARARN